MQDEYAGLTLRPAEAAQALGLSQEELAALLRCPSFPTLCVGMFYRIPRAALAEWIAHVSAQDDIGIRLLRDAHAYMASDLEPPPEAVLSEGEIVPPPKAGSASERSETP